MAVRRLDPNQPASFAFKPENLAWAQATIAKYPEGKQASAVIPLLWRGQEQEGWVTEPMIRVIGDMLGMAYVRVYEIATFYTMFQLSPVGRIAHVQVCGTTPCMLRGAEDLIKVCKSRIAAHAHELSADGNFSWEEVECLGACANAPLVQIFKDTYEDLTPDLLVGVLEGFAAGKPPKPGSMVGRQASSPAGGPTTLTDPSLFDGSRLGAWKKRLEDADAAAAAKKAAEAAAAAAEAAKAQGSPVAAPAPSSAGLAVAGVAGGAAAAAVSGATGAGAAAGASTAGGAGIAGAPSGALSAPRGGKGDDLTLLWGVAEKLQAQLNAKGIWHFDQIAAWTPADVAWFERTFPGMDGRVERDKWIEQCKKLAEGWRPGTDAGERPKG